MVWKIFATNPPLGGLVRSVRLGEAEPNRQAPYDNPLYFDLLTWLSGLRHLSIGPSDDAVLLELLPAIAMLSGRRNAPPLLGLHLHVTPRILPSCIHLIGSLSAHLVHLSLSQGPEPVSEDWLDGCIVVLPALRTLTVAPAASAADPWLPKFVDNRVGFPELVKFGWGLAQVVHAVPWPDSPVARSELEVQVLCLSRFDQLLDLLDESEGTGFVEIGCLLPGPCEDRVLEPEGQVCPTLERILFIQMTPFEASEDHDRLQAGIVKIVRPSLLPGLRLVQWILPAGISQTRSEFSVSVAPPSFPIWAPWLKLRQPCPLAFSSVGCSI